MKTSFILNLSCHVKRLNPKGTGQFIKDKILGATRTYHVRK